MTEVLVKINPTGRKDMLMNISLTYSHNKDTLNRVNKEIKE